jgi:hypothetical protein
MVHAQHWLELLKSNWVSFLELSSELKLGSQFFERNRIELQLGSYLLRTATGIKILL